MIEGFYSEDQIQERIIRIVHRAREEFGIPEGSTGAFACDALDLELSHQPLMGRDGFWLEKQIVVNPSDSIERTEFSIYHEIMHYLIDEDGDLIEFLTNRLHGKDNANEFKARLERYCNAGAAEFLVPRKRVRECIDTYGFSVDLIELIATNHGASILASSIQLGLYAPEDCYVIVCSYGSCAWFRGTGPTLFVDQATMRRNMKYPLVRDSPIPADHFFWNVFRFKQRMTDTPTFIEFARSHKRIRMEYGEAVPMRDRVLGVLYEKRRPRTKDSGQARLL